MDAAAAEVVLWGGRLLAIGALGWGIKKWVWPTMKGLHELVVAPKEEAREQRERADIWRKFDELNRKFDAARESSDTMNRRVAGIEVTLDQHTRDLKSLDRAVGALGRRVENIEKVHDMCPRATDVLPPEGS